MDKQEIKNTIIQLAAGPTTFDACSKLASLYVIMNQWEEPKMSLVESAENKNVVAEYNDILPSYKIYCDKKREYQLGKTGPEQMQKAFADLCTEIYEFLHILYSNTETKEERTSLANTLIDLVNLFG